MGDTLYFTKSDKTKSKEKLDKLVRASDMTVQFDDGKERIYSSEAMLITEHKNYFTVLLFDDNGELAYNLRRMFLDN